MSLQGALDGCEAHDLSLARSGHRATVWIDGQPTPILLAEDGGACVVELDGRRESVWTVTDRDQVFIHAFERSWSVHLSDPAERSLRAGVSSDAATAPMPGVLVSVLVEPGEQVCQGQVVAVIESMKMHSEILAPRDGRVARLLVGLGENFDQGAGLVALEPEPEPEPPDAAAEEA